jgi:P-aminobenzoate N-oxygenase AurF
MSANPIPVSERCTKELRRLAKVSHKMPMDLNRSIPWELGVNKSLRPKSNESSWIYGTAHWDVMTPEQRQALLWEEVARDVSMFIWLEQTLPPLYMGYINQFGDQLCAEVRDYLMIFSKEEIVHTMAFRRYSELAGLKHFRPSEGIQELFQEQLPKMPPVAGILCTLIIEYIAELGAMHATQHEDVDPLTRTLFKRHHVDELRHIAFGRWVAESYFQQATPEETAKLRGIAKTLVGRAIPQYTFNAEVIERVPIVLKTSEDIEAIRDSAHNREVNRDRFAELYTWLGRLGVEL